MRKKTEFFVNLSLPDTITLIVAEGKKQGIYVRSRKVYMLIRKPKLVFGVFPINFQVSFVAILSSKRDGTLITGKFDAPRLFYLLYFILFFLFTGMFLVVTNVKNGSAIKLLPNITILGGTGFFVIKVATAISKMCFANQNSIVTDFLKSISSS